MRRSAFRLHSKSDVKVKRGTGTSTSKSYINSLLHAEGDRRQAERELERKEYVKLITFDRKYAFKSKARLEVGANVSFTGASGGEDGTLKSIVEMYIWTIESIVDGSGDEDFETGNYDVILTRTDIMTGNKITLQTKAYRVMCLHAETRVVEAGDIVSVSVFGDGVDWLEESERNVWLAMSCWTREAPRQTNQGEGGRDDTPFALRNLSTGRIVKKIEARKLRVYDFDRL
jgi:hypothetical protein